MYKWLSGEASGSRQAKEDAQRVQSAQLISTPLQVSAATPSGTVGQQTFSEQTLSNQGMQGRVGSPRPSNDAEERPRLTPVSEQTERQWIAITAYQPIDTVTKTVEVPVVRTVETYVPKITVEEKVIEVPKYVPEYVEKVVEIPEVQYVDKVVEIPEYQVQYKYVPKVETEEKIIQRPKYETKYIEKVVEVNQIKEVVRYQDVEEVEEVIRYVPKDQAIPEEWLRAQEEQKKREEEVKLREEKEQQILQDLEGEERELHIKRMAEQARFQQQVTMQQEIAKTEQERAARARQDAKAAQFPVGDAAAPMSPIPKIEQVFKSKVVKQVEIQKHVPIAVDVPVPYMVPKPVVIPVQVPVLKFRDHFVPVPVRRRVIPRIRWSNEVYEVECIKEKPFLQVQDVIKPVPCDVEIKMHEFVERAAPINPAELSQADIHAMWMRVNADLAEKRKAELGDKYPYIKHPQGTVFGEPGSSRQEREGEEGGEHETINEERKGVEPLALHPGHPLNMTYLQNEWIKKETVGTHEIYTPEWFEAHQKALNNLTMQHPTQVQLSAEQAAQLQQQEAQFDGAPWLEKSSEKPSEQPAQGGGEKSQPCSVCDSVCGGGDGKCKC